MYYSLVHGAFTQVNHIALYDYISAIRKSFTAHYLGTGCISDFALLLSPVFSVLLICSIIKMLQNGEPNGLSPHVGLVIEARRNQATVLRAVAQRVYTL